MLTCRRSGLTGFRLLLISHIPFHVHFPSRVSKNFGSEVGKTAYSALRHGSSTNNEPLLSLFGQCKKEIQLERIMPGSWVGSEIVFPRPLTWQGVTRVHTGTTRFASEMEIQVPKRSFADCGSDIFRQFDNVLGWAWRVPILGLQDKIFTHCLQWGWSSIEQTRDGEWEMYRLRHSPSIERKLSLLD
jgi:hypothetical protein